MAENNRDTTRGALEKINSQEEKIIRLLREERKLVKEKFPLSFALAATVGAACTLSGINKLIDKVAFFQQYPITLVIIGLTILLITGAAYRKLG